MATRKRTTKTTPKMLDKAMDEVRDSRPDSTTGTKGRRQASKGPTPKEKGDVVVPAPQAPQTAPQRTKNSPSPVGRPDTEQATQNHPEAATGQQLVVFAFRLTEAEREQLHRAAGRGKASWFVKTIALAVATGDSDSFEQVLQAIRPISD